MTGVESDLPPDLALAFADYERAIVENDLAALDAAFAPGPGTMRADAAGLLIGHDAISSFRGARGGVRAGGRVGPAVKPRDDGVGGGRAAP